FPQGHEAWQGAITEFNTAAKLANPGLDLTSISEGGHERKEGLYKESQRIAANRTGGNYLRIYQKTYRNG
ncbi:MAG: hypothetical protein PHE27_07550, partial [Alphaproteobacteria bacterium]|nr:hypothetical protein [Alphaproteobacteria bacterium]